MSDDIQGPSEDDLQALVDGRLDASRRDEVEAWLAEHPEQAERVRDLRDQGDAIREAYGPLLDRPVPEHLRTVAGGQADAAPVWRMAAMIALLVVGAAGGWFANDALEERVSATADLTREAVQAHSLFIREKRHAVEVGADEQAHLVAWLSRRLEAELVAPNLEDDGYRLVGGRILPARDAGPAAQFMYETDKGNRVTLYIEQDQLGSGTAFEFSEHDGVSAFWWQDGPLAYVLIGETPREVLLTLARATKDQFSR